MLTSKITKRNMPRRITERPLKIKGANWVRQDFSCPRGRAFLLKHQKHHEGNDYGDDDTQNELAAAAG